MGWDLHASSLHAIQGPGWQQECWSYGSGAGALTDKAEAVVPITVAAFFQPVMYVSGQIGIAAASRSSA